ncbi:hypothetical protein ACFFX0_19990 [Citricoccus parietis]|uniref:Uncharacterized protein n=1 Tax=Citricoccus parietis TaxID=592307 RepID=A0ABV5G3X7_9MICC
MVVDLLAGHHDAASLATALALGRQKRVEPDPRLLGQGHDLGIVDVALRVLVGPAQVHLDLIWRGHGHSCLSDFLWWNSCPPPPAPPRPSRPARP